MSTYHMGTYDLDIRDVLKSYIIARYYGWEPKEEDLEEIQNYWNLTSEKVIITDIIPIPQPG